MEYTNTEIVDLLIEGFGVKDTIIFCDIYSALKKAMSNSPLDEKMYDAYWFEDKKEELLQQIQPQKYKSQYELISYKTNNYEGTINITDYPLKQIQNKINAWINAQYKPAEDLLRQLCQQIPNDFELGNKIREVYGAK